MLQMFKTKKSDLEMLDNQDRSIERLAQVVDRLADRVRDMEACVAQECSKRDMREEEDKEDVLGS